MKLKIFVTIWVLMFFACIPPAFAEFYHYVDEYGVRHYTDDLSEVPEDQREGVKTVEEVKPQPPGSPAPGAPGNSFKTPPAGADQAVNGPAGSSSAVPLEDLAQTKKDLKAEFEALVRERVELQKLKGKVGDKEFGEKVVELNSRIKSYHEKHDKLNEMIMQHNKKVEEQNRKMISDKPGN